MAGNAAAAAAAPVFAGGSRAPFVARVFFHHTTFDNGRTGFAFTTGGSTALGTNVATLAGLTQSAAGENRLITPHPPRALTITAIKPLRLTMTPTFHYHVRERSATFTFSSNLVPAGVSVSVAYGNYPTGTLLLAAITAAILAQTGYNVAGTHNTTTGFASFTHDAAATSFSVLPARSDKALMEMLGFLTTNAAAGVTHVGNMQLSPWRDLGYFVCLRHSNATLLVSPAQTRSTDALMFAPWKTGYNMHLVDGQTTRLDLDGNNAAPTFLPVNLSLHNAEIFLRDSNGDELGASQLSRWIFEAELTLVPT